MRRAQTGIYQVHYRQRTFSVLHFRRPTRDTPNETEKATKNMETRASNRHKKVLFFLVIFWRTVPVGRFAPSIFRGPFSINQFGVQNAARQTKRIKQRAWRRRVKKARKYCFFLLFSVDHFDFVFFFYLT